MFSVFIFLLTFTTFIYPTTLTLTELQTIKTTSSQQYQPQEKPLPFQSLLPKKNIPLKKLPPYEKAFWWQIFPTTGMRLEKPFWPLRYPFLPHAFPLWQMASSLGKGIDVMVIDTGVAAFSFTHKNITYVQHPDLLIAGNFKENCYNQVPLDNRSGDLFENLVQLIDHYTAPVFKNKLSSQTVSEWIRTYLHDKKTDSLDNYLKQYGLQTLQEKHHDSIQFTVEGNRVRKAILEGDCGFSSFNLVTITGPCVQKDLFLQYIPTVSHGRSMYCHKESPYLMNADHGTHVASLIGARLHPSLEQYKPFTEQTVRNLLQEDSGLTGVAPYTTMGMIKALAPERMSTDIACVTKALRKATQLNSSIVNLSLKIDESHSLHDPATQALYAATINIPYLVVAAGNEALQKPGVLAYPACFDSVHFSVGSFGCTYDNNTDTYHCPLSSFSQYETRKGPLYVAPGQAILGCSFNQKTKAPTYAFHTGTSYAAPLVSGFLALMLAEFKDDFTREQLLFVCDTGCLKLHADQAWKERVVHGVIDMRTVLFTLHVLKKIKEEKYQDQYVFNQSFKKLATAVHDILFSMADEYGKELDIKHSFQSDYLGYFNTILHAKSHAAVLDEPYFQSFDAAVHFVKNKALEQFLKKGFSSQGSRAILKK